MSRPEEQQPLAGDSQTSRRQVALIVGNSAYEHAGYLPNPRRDADAMASALSRLGFEVLKGLDQDKRNLERLVRQFSDDIEIADVGLLFYAGHGLQVDDVNYIVPTDAELRRVKDVHFEAISLSDIQHHMEMARTSIIILDACRNNPLARSLAGATGARSVSLGRGLARMNAVQGSYIAFATAPGHEATDGRGEHSPFTGALLAEIESEGVSITDLMISVRNSVIEATGGRQVPWDQSALRAPFYFKPIPRASSDAVAEEIWKAIEALDNSEPFEKFVRDFPDHRRVWQARAVLGRLEQKAWSAIAQTDRFDALDAFLAKFPAGPHAALAQSRLSALRADEQDWRAVSTKTERTELEAFLAAHPQSRFVLAAQDRIASLASEAREWETVEFTRSIPEIDAFLERYPDLRFAQAARRWRDELLEAESSAWNQAAASKSTKSLEEYLASHPGSPFADDARGLLKRLAAAEQAWLQIEQATDPGRLERFLADHPDSPCCEAATERIKALRAARQEWDTIRKSMDVDGPAHYAVRVPTPIYAAEAQQRLELLRNERAETTKTKADEEAAASQAVGEGAGGRDESIWPAVVGAVIGAGFLAVAAYLAFAMFLGAYSAISRIGEVGLGQASCELADMLCPSRHQGQMSLPGTWSQACDATRDALGCRPIERPALPPLPGSLACRLDRSASACIEFCTKNPLDQACRVGGPGMTLPGMSGTARPPGLELPPSTREPLVPDSAGRSPLKSGPGLEREVYCHKNPTALVCAGTATTK